MPITVNGAVVSNTSLLICACATLVTLSSGTNYVVGSWAPQYADRMHFDSKTINLIASAGNWGVYTSGPFMGYIADKRGPRAITFFGSVLLGAGYLGLCWAYSAADVHTTPVILLAIFSYMTGLGSCAGSTAGLNAVAKAFPPEARGLAMGITVAGYGLSAFVYATISGYIVGDNTGAFLLILAIGTSVSFAFSASVFTPDRTGAYSALPTEESNVRGPDRISSEMSSLSPERGSPSSRDEEIAIADSKGALRTMPADTGGLMLFKKIDYWLIMIVTFAATGTGLMWINNVGTVVVTLAKFNGTPGSSTRLQSQQTSLLSLFNCLGRLFIGAASDSASSRYGIRPVWWLVCLCLSFIVSQLIAQSSAELGRLSIATAVTGFAYGEFYGVAPVILLDWYGMTYFSTNVGTLYCVPTFSSYIFSNMFGVIYDSNIPSYCYAQVFNYTLLACTIALAISVLLGWRTGRQIDPGTSKRRKSVAALIH